MAKKLIPFLMYSIKLSSLFFIIHVVFNASSEKIECKEESIKLQDIEDPRSVYQVDLGSFQKNLSINIDEAVNNITIGDGYVILKGLFNKEDIQHARETILYLISKQGNKATHFQGQDDSKTELQARVWNLLNKGPIFEKLVQHPTILEINRRILGDDCQLGSIASNTIFPGGSGQEPHIDYPYWDYYDKRHWPYPPKHRDIPFLMNMQTTIALDPFTENNGATAIRTGTQKFAEYPEDIGEFMANMIQPRAEAGDVIMFTGVMQHCAMPNKSDKSRTGILIQMLPKYIRPMEDQKKMVLKSVLARASSDIKKILLLDYPYPAVLDNEGASNSEGRNSDFKWK